MIRLRQIKVSIFANTEALPKKIIQKLKINEKALKSYTIIKESIDARDKNNINYVYEVDVEVLNEDLILHKLKDKDIFKAPIETYYLPQMGDTKLNNRIIIVGSGPSGLFAAYLLSETGYKPLIIERGAKLEDRIKDVETFWKQNILNPESNVQFGEGGAGTFSDGKLNTLIKDSRHIGKKVLEIFVKHGAPPEILYLKNPHIGTDILRTVIKNIREYILSKGGEFSFNTKLTNLIIENNKLTKIEVNNKNLIPCEALILAIGHSARDTFYMLNSKLQMEPKSFAVGIRIMHNQSMINNSEYGSNSKYLPNASYKLTYKAQNKRGVYTFCMCPGGYVVNASSEQSKLAINGMSNYKRDSGIANSAIIVTINPNDFGNEPLKGIEFQRKLEQKAYEVGKKSIPIQLYKDYQNNQISTQFLGVKPMFKGSYTFANINDILPNFINEALKEAIPVFDQKIKGFASPDAIISAIESRTSSPLRILRDENMESNIKGIYPCGEGAGYAGGITTSAIDGIKVAEILIKKYHN